GEDGAGVIGATEWIERMKLEPGFGIAGVTRAVVMGGGNTGSDVARELAKLGVPNVTLVYRRTAAEMPGYAHEMEHARTEGVTMLERAVPQEIVRDANGKLTGLKLEDGRALEADLVVLGIGQARLRQVAEGFTGVKLDDKGRLAAAESGIETAGSEDSSGRRSARDHWPLNRCSASNPVVPCPAMQYF